VSSFLLVTLQGLVLHFPKLTYWVNLLDVNAEIVHKFGGTKALENRERRPLKYPQISNNLYFSFLCSKVDDHYLTTKCGNY